MQEVQYTVAVALPCTLQQWRKGGDDRPSAVIIADGRAGRVPGIQSRLGPWRDFQLPDLQSSRDNLP